MMNSQMLIGGSHKMEDTPQFRSALEKRQMMLMKEFDQKLQEFESPERDAIDHDKAQAEKFKSLLLKQRDIMVALTTKLNERDESLVMLQDQLELYENVYIDHEDLINSLKDTFKILESTLKDNNISVPNCLIQNEEKINKFLEEKAKLLFNISSIKTNSFNNSKAFGKAKAAKSTQEKIYVPYHVEKNEEGM